MIAISLCLLLALSVLAPFWGRLNGFRYFHSFILLGLSVYFIRQFSGAESHLENYGAYFPLFDIRFLSDALNNLLASVVCVIGFGVSLYTYSYFSGTQKTAHFHGLLYLFCFSMLGIIFSENLLLLFCFWELSSVSSYLLIGFESSRTKARWAATQAFLVTGLGGLVMLCGLIIWGVRMGTLNSLELWELRETWRNFPEMPWITALIFIGAFTKSAQFPFHFWLPNAMKAPTPASSFLHSATMVKAGVILLLRLSPLLRDQSIWVNSLIPVGSITVLIACGLCLLESDLKKILAYTTLAALGLLFILLALPNPEISTALCILFLMVHAFYKAPLFLLLGNIEAATGHRDFAFVHGLREKMPGTFAGTLLASLGLLGFFPTLGFAVKELIFENITYSPWLLFVFIVAFSSFSYVAYLFILRVFGGALWSAEADEKSLLSFVVPFLLASLSLFLGSFLMSWIEQGVHSAQYGLGLNSNIQLSVWHGLSIPFALSVLCWAIGFFIYKTVKAQTYDREAWLLRISKKSFNHLYDFLYDSLLRLAKMTFAFFQHGRFPIYLLSIFIFAIFFLWTSMNGFPFYEIKFKLSGISLTEYLLVFVVAFGAVLSLWLKNILQILVALGLVGFGIALLYLALGAPDLALTQFLVETLSLLMFLFCLRILPSEQSPVSFRSLLATSIVSGLFAFFVGWVTYLSSQDGARGKIRDFFGDLSLAVAHGRNVVNVIIVDFRGLDTMGEITVLVVAAIGLISLLRWKAKGVS
jgi:multicomponent Na+:H+ antiporter subunit A